MCETNHNLNLNIGSSVFKIKISVRKTECNTGNISYIK